MGSGSWGPSLLARVCSAAQDPRRHTGQGTRPELGARVPVSAHDKHKHKHVGGREFQFNEKLFQDSSNCKMRVLNKHPSLEMTGNGGTVRSPGGTAPAAVCHCRGQTGVSTGHANPRVYRSNPGAEHGGASKAAARDSPGKTEGPTSEFELRNMGCQRANLDPTPGPGCVNRRFVGTRKVPESSAHPKTRTRRPRWERPRHGSLRGLWDENLAPFAQYVLLKAVSTPHWKVSVCTFICHFRAAIDKWKNQGNAYMGTCTGGEPGGVLSFWAGVRLGGQGQEEGQVSLLRGSPRHLGHKTGASKSEQRTPRECPFGLGWRLGQHGGSWEGAEWAADTGRPSPERFPLHSHTARRSCV